MPISVINILPQLNRESSNEDFENGFEWEVKLFLFCLKFTGLHYFNWSGNEGRKIVHRLAGIYRGFVPALLVVNFLFSLGEFTDVHGFNGALLNSLISSIWFMQVALFSLNNAARCWRWARLYKLWNNYEHEYEIGYKEKNKRMSVISVICYLFWLLIASAFMGVSMSTPRPPSGFMVYIPEGLIVLTTIFIVVAYFFFVSTWFLLTTQFVLICVSICRLLQDLYDIIKRDLENRENISENIENLRQQHDKICVMILQADDILSMFIMITVASTIPLIVLTLYFVIFVGDDVQSFSYAATWWSISLSTLQLAVVFLFGGAVNYMAHKSTDLLYRLDLRSFKQTSIAQLSVFLNRLTSQPIGLTACGLFVFDKPTIVTFVGSIATYAIVMIQFKPSDSGCTVVCNCTTSTQT